MSIFSTIRGNLGQNFSLRTINRDGEPSTVLNFSVASTRYKRQKTADGGSRYEPAGPAEWVECEYWNRQAPHLEKVLSKGMPVVVDGEELIEFYEKDGQKIKVRKLRVENIYLNLASERIDNIVLKPPRTAENADDDGIPF
ncbi:single-stranded DNA-binding protein [Neisseria sp. 23W00296]|uniref:single-stranded DNA-binding protein n=1 Tax=unclassified Neisseria TaxID=2623750 RepID=UPI0037579AEE